MTRHMRFGSWPSLLDAVAVSASSPRIDGSHFVGDAVWWAESMPDEGGRTAVRRLGEDGVENVLPAPWNARSRVHEYGGGAWTATDAGVLLFVEKSDQRVWAVPPGQKPHALTPDGGDTRFGGLSLQNGQLLAIRETHLDGAAVPRREIVRIGLDGSGVEPLVDGSDFVAHPALSPGGTHLAWVAWNHPDMPWDRAELRVGRIEDGVVVEWTTVAGGDTAPLQPVWSGDDELIFADDVTGRWNLWREYLSADLARTAVAPADADTGAPVWVLGSRWFARLEDGRIVAVRTHGDDVLVLIDGDGSERPLPAPPVSEMLIEDVRGTRVLVSGSPADAPAGLWALDVDSDADPDLIRGGTSPWGAQWMPRARPVSFDGPGGPVHAFDFPPTNPDVAGVPEERAPYVVYVHGGPTTHRGSGASARIAYFTSRGIGVLEVNYGGSSGYGRAYRERLRGQWGVVDVADVAAAAHGLAAEGVADPARIAIAGGSAGGWTVLAALANTDAFAAGISRYGVGDARALATDTHDFEARYLDGLIGPLPEAEAVYIERSPLTHPERFRVPLLLLQGADDPVVPPSQSEAIRDALAEHGVPHAYVVYEGEGHGFRRADTVVHALQSELAFLGAVFGFETPDVPPLLLD